MAGGDPDRSRVRHADGGLDGDVSSSETSFNIIFRFVITPMFLFSGTFFPISQLPAFIQPIAWLTPLFHGVALTRSLGLGQPLEPWQYAVHIGYLVTLVVVGTALAFRTFRKQAGGVGMASVPVGVGRILPFGSRHSVHILERNRLVFRRGWMVIFTGFFEPLFYLLGIGFGLGSLIGTVTGPDGSQIPYSVFVAPALLAASAMNGAVYDSTNMFFRLRYEKAYDGMLATPMNVGDIALGEIMWALVRGALYGFGFLIVMFALGLVPSPWGLLALPASMLIGFATAAAGLTAVTFMRGWQDLDLIFVITLPLFLFSATFFPIDVYPPALQWIVEISPLYRGVDLIRGLTTGVVGVSQLIDVIYLSVMGVVFLWIASRRLGRMLTK